MPDITRVFNDETRSLTSVERKYAGQIGDAISTVMHFEYTKLDFLMGYRPYIMFGVYDDDGNPLIYGPEPDNPSEAMEDVLEERVFFNGYTFTIPWAVTSRVKSMRVDYQLFFVKNGVEFDGRNVAKLKPTEVLMSAVDSIALKPSITCAKKSSCNCPPFAPTGSEPNILGWINLWRDYGLVLPVTQDLKEPEFLDRFGVPYEPTEEDLVKNPPVIRLNFRTYNGKNDSTAEFGNVPVMINGKLLYYQLPYGGKLNQVPLLGGDIGDGKSIVYDAASNRFVEYDITGIYQFRGICSSADLDRMAASGNTLAGAPLRNGDVYSLTDVRTYGVDELGNPKQYEPGTNWVWSEQNVWEPLTGDLNLDKYQLKSFRVTEWAEPTDEQYPSAKLTKDSLDAQNDALKAHADRKDNPHDVSKSQVGLGNVDNTSDMDKPVSTAMQTALDKKVDKVAGKGLSTNDYTDAEKIKLEGIAEGAQVNVIEKIKVNGTEVAPTAKAVDISVPSKTSDLSNDSGYITKAVADLENYYTKTETDAKINAVKQFDIRVVDSLPSTGESGVIYLVPSETSRSKNVKDEYIWVDGAWEQIGSTSFKLDIAQSADAISINGTALQSASDAQIGLMTPALVNEFRAKQDPLIAGTNIVIENGIISATGGGSSVEVESGGHASVTCTIPAGQSVVNVKHKLNSFELIFQLRTTVPPISYPEASIVALDSNNIQVIFTEPPASEMKLNIIEASILHAPVNGLVGHASASCIVPAGQNPVDVKHNLDSYELVFKLRTTVPPITFPSADMVALDENTVRLTFSKTPESDMRLNLLACDKYVSSQPDTGLTVRAKAISTPSTVWTADNPTGKPVYVQLFDSTGNEIRADMVQNSEDQFTPVVANLDRNLAGTMLIAKADICIPFTDQENYSVDVTAYGFAKSDKFLVQLYVDGTGRSMPDIIQDSNTGIVSIDFGDTPISGYLTLTKASVVQEFSDATEVVCQHNLGRVVGVQAYSEGTGQLMADIVCTDSNTVTVSSNIAITGYLLVL